VAQGSVDGMNEIKARINQRAVKVEDDQPYGMWIECPIGTNHAQLRIALSCQQSALSKIRGPF